MHALAPWCNIGPAQIAARASDRARSPPEQPTRLPGRQLARRLKARRRGFEVPAVSGLNGGGPIGRNGRAAWYRHRDSVCHFLGEVVDEFAIRLSMSPRNPMRRPRATRRRVTSIATVVHRFRPQTQKACCSRPGPADPKGINTTGNQRYCATARRSFFLLW